MKRPRFLIVDLVLLTAAVGLGLGGIIERDRHPARFDGDHGAIAVAALAASALVFRWLRPLIRRARMAELVRRYAPPPVPAPLPDPDSAAFLESRTFRDVRSPRLHMRSRP